MGKDAWEEMEAKATEMTRKRYDEKRKVEEKLGKIRRFNLDHPIIVTEIAYQSEPEPETELVVDPIDYNPVWYVLNYLTPPRKKKK